MYVRTVPSMTQRSGITLSASPAWIFVTEITQASVGWTFRETIVWKPCTSWHATGTGSTLRCGIPA